MKRETAFSNTEKLLAVEIAVTYAQIDFDSEWSLRALMTFFSLQGLVAYLLIDLTWHDRILPKISQYMNSLNHNSSYFALNYGTSAQTLIQNCVFKS